MEKSPQVAFHNVAHSRAVEDRVLEYLAKLEKFFPRITACHVVIEGKPRHKKKGTPYAVSMTIQVPGDSIHISRRPGRDEDHEDIYVMLRDAFAAARRQLEDYSRKRRGDVKVHVSPREQSAV